MLFAAVQHSLHRVQRAASKCGALNPFEAMREPRRSICHDIKAFQISPTADPMRQMEDAVAVQKENIETVVRAGTSAASRGVDKAVSMTKEQVEAAVSAGARAFKGYEEFLEFGKENVEAAVKASTIFARGLQSLSQSMVGVAQASIEGQVAAGKALIAAKSVQEVIELSSTMTKANFERLMAEGGKLTEISTKLAEEAFVPLTHRVDRGGRAVLQDRRVTHDIAARPGGG